MRVIITCEHGGNRVPAAYRALFASPQAAAALESHRGYDLGSLELGRRLARHMHAPLHAATVTRLLVELNRSLHHPQLFSAFTRNLDRQTKQRIITRYYQPHRSAVQRRIAQWIRRKKPVLHVGVHTFTPVFNGELRNADIGLLYDPAALCEKRFAELWRSEIKSIAPQIRVRMNYPYRGKSDGLVTALRKQFDASHYLGIELEVNQRFPLGPRAAWLEMQQTIVRSFAAAWAGF